MADSEGGVPRDLIAQNFGYLIAYMVPGAVGLVAISFRSAELGTWIKEAGKGNSDLGAFLTLALAALGVGMVLHLLRWFIFERLLVWITPQSLRDRWQLDAPTYDHERAFRSSALQARLAVIVDQHYRYYQHHGALAIVLPLWFIAWMSRTGASPGAIWVAGVGIAFLSILSFFAALDALKRTRVKTAKLTTERLGAA